MYARPPLNSNSSRGFGACCFHGSRKGSALAHSRVPKPLYSGVGSVKRHDGICEPGAESRPPREAGRSSRALDAATGSPSSIWDEAPGSERGLVLSRIFRLVSTKARFLESCAGHCYHQPSTGSSVAAMIRFPNSPFCCRGRQSAQSICRWRSTTEILELP